MAGVRVVDGEQIGRTSLLLDAVYCAAVGTVVAVTARPLARTVALPSAAVAGAGAATVVWAGLVAAAGHRHGWRAEVAAVGGANLVAGSALIALGTRRPGTGRWLLVGTGLDVLGFAASQAFALAADDGDAQRSG